MKAFKDVRPLPASDIAGKSRSLPLLEGAVAAALFMLACCLGLSIRTRPVPFLLVFSYGAECNEPREKFNSKNKS